MKIIPEHLVEKISLVQKKPVKVFEIFMGILFVRNWEQIEDPNVIRFDDRFTDSVLNIYKDNFTEIYEDRFLKYAHYFNNICYVYRDDEDVKGYCFFFAKPLFSTGRMRKLCIVYSIAVDSRYKRQGVGEKLLRKGIREMELNGVDAVILYVEVNNESAIRLYKKAGFKIINEVKDICSPGDMCYEMMLDLSENSHISSLYSNHQDKQLAFFYFIFVPIYYMLEFSLTI